MAQTPHLLTRINDRGEQIALHHEQNNNTNDATAHDQDVFNFEQWLKRNKLQDLRDVFKQYDMHSQSTLSLTSSNFSRFIVDARVLANAHLIGDIIRAIQSLSSSTPSQPPPQPSSASSKSQSTSSSSSSSCPSNTLILQMSREETETVRELKRYKHVMTGMKNECKLLSDECDAKKLKHEQRVHSYQRVCTRELSTLKRSIDEHFDGVCNVLRETQSRLLAQVNAHEAEIAAIASAQTTRSAALDKVVHSYLRDIDAETHYIQQQIVRCKDIIAAEHCNSNPGDGDGDDYEFVTEFDDDRTNKVMRVGQATKTHYEHALCDINAYKREIEQFLHCAMLQGFEDGGDDDDKDDDDKQQRYYHVRIDDAQRVCIENALRKYVSISVDPRTLNRHNYVVKVKNGFSASASANASAPAVAGGVSRNGNYDEHTQETSTIAKARSSVMNLQCAASDKTNSRRGVKQYAPLPTAMDLDLSLSESKRNEQILSCQDQEYHRAFSFTDLSVNPFSVNPFANNPFKKKKSPAKHDDDVKQAPPPPPKNDARSKEKARYEKALTIARERYKAPKEGKEFNFFFDCGFLPKAIADAQDDGYQREFDYYVLRSPFKPQKQIRLTKLKKIKKLLPSLLSTSSTSSSSSSLSSSSSHLSHSSHSFLSAYSSPFAFNTNAPEFVPSHGPDTFGHHHSPYNMNGHCSMMNDMNNNGMNGMNNHHHHQHNNMSGMNSFHQLPEIATILTAPPSLPAALPMPLLSANFIPFTLGPFADFSPMSVLSPLNPNTITPTHSAQQDSPLHDNSPNPHQNNSNHMVATHHQHHSNGTASLTSSPSRGNAMPPIEEEAEEFEEEEEEFDGELICGEEGDNDEGMVFTFHPQNTRNQLVAMSTM